MIDNLVLLDIEHGQELNTAALQVSEIGKEQQLYFMPNTGYVLNYHS